MRTKSIATLVSMIGVSIILSSCSSGSPEPYKTPAPPPTSQGEKSSTQTNSYGDPREGGDNAPGKMTSLSEGKAFNVDTSDVKIPDEVSKIWKESANKAPEDALMFLQTSNMIEQRWLDVPNSTSTDNFRPVEESMTPEGWTRLSEAVQSGDQDKYASSLVPGRTDGDSIGEAESVVPLVRTPQNLSFNVAQDEKKFGDTLARLQVDADLYFLFPPKGQGIAPQYKRHVTLYMIPSEQKWLVDNWDVTPPLEKTS